MAVPAGDGLCELYLTLSPSKYDEFLADLEVLREHGAGSNTEAILEAVRVRADGVRVAAVDDRSAA